MTCSTLLVLTLWNPTPANTIHAAPAPEWNWTAASPETQGLAASKWEALWTDLQSRRTSALLVIRHDQIVFERYAGTNNQNTKHYTASMAKALVGGVSLALALTDGRMALDDLASKYVPQWANDPAKSKITIRHLGSHTSGLADAKEGGLPHEKLTGWPGDFWKRLPTPNDPFTISRDTTPVLFEPGTGFQYSNPGLAMLGYAIASALKQTPQKDLRSLLRDRVMRPIGVPDADWSIGYGQTVNIEGLPVVATWGGGNFTPRAVARVGRLMLRKGDWEGRRLIAATAVEAVTTDASTPRNCGMGWWSNNDGTIERLPKTAFWGSGAGHQILLVVPSWNLMVVRNGEALDPAKPYDAALREHFFEPFIRAVNRPGDAGRAWIWPSQSWTKASPAEAGMDAARLGQARDYALTGGGSGYVTRGGKLVLAWGDPAELYDLKSSSKSIGVTALGLALLDGKVKLDDLAKQHHPAFGAPPESNAQTGWLDKITLRHLANQTAGFEKPGGYTKLLFAPGTKWHYSDGGPNWLAECLTLVYGRDLNDVLFERVFTPLGIRPGDIRWRKNSYRPDLIDGLKRREFGAGFSANVDAMARLGYLYLREGQWQEQRILPQDFVELARQPAKANIGLPELDDTHGNASDHYSLLWWNNGDGTIRGVPRDACWSWGLYDSLIVVIPSLDVVVARAGKSWKRTTDEHYDVLKPFLEPIAASVREFERRTENAGLDGPNEPMAKRAAPPYPPSPVVKEVIWAPKETIFRAAKGSDNWPLTWADDGALYTAYGDGNGFAPLVPQKLSLGLTKITGSPGAFSGVNIRSASMEQKGEGPAGKKASGIIMVDGVLYLWVRNAVNSQLAWSRDHGATWTWSDWKFTQSFGCPTFLNFGKNYAGARDEFVYVYSPDSNNAYAAADRFVLARVPKEDVRRREAYDFFRGLDAAGRPVWTKEIDERGAVFSHPGQCYRSGITYNAALKRYLWCQILPASKHPQGPRFQGGFGIYDAPEPWGPWTTVCFTDAWDVGPGESSSFPTKWMSADGQTLHLVFSGDDHFSVRQATLTLRENPAADKASAPTSDNNPRTRVSIVNGRWHINGDVTYRGAKAEGLLLNVRAVNATFEDTKRPEFDAEANTAEFLAQLPEYVAHGVRAFTLNLQGGTPGYEGAVNSAFQADGSLREFYVRRIRRVIEACDQHGAVVILGCFYQRQDQVLKDENAVRAGVVNAVKWIQAGGFQNVILEIANEFGHGGFDHRILKEPGGQVELIQLAKRTAPDLLVATSGLGGGSLPDNVAGASDFLLIHFNSTPLEEIPRRIASLKKYNKPIVCNEDQKLGEQGAQAAELCVANGASWGLMLEKRNQHFPFTFSGPADDPAVYAMLRKLAGRGD